MQKNLFVNEKTMAFQIGIGCFCLLKDDIDTDSDYDSDEPLYSSLITVFSIPTSLLSRFMRTDIRLV